MNININNYEEFFLLYADDELTAEERAMVDHFVSLHPDLEEELNMLSQTKLPAEEEVTFVNKATLYKYNKASLINETNYSEYFLLYVDNELNVEERKAVEAFAALNNDKQTELHLLQKATLQPNENITFINKDILYRTEKKPARMVYMRWISIAAAAAVLLTGIAVWTNINDDETITGDKPETVVAETHTAKENSNKQNSVNQQVEKSSEAFNTPEQKANMPARDKSLTQTNADNIIVKQTSEGVNPATNDFQKPTGIKGKNTTDNPVAKNNEHTIETVIKDISVPEVAVQQSVVSNNITKTDRNVKPLILDATAFNGQDKNSNENQVEKKNDQVVFLDADNNDKKPKGKLRGLFRKASRIIDHATNAGEVNDQSVVRVASFEIAKK